MEVVALLLVARNRFASRLRVAFSPAPPDHLNDSFFEAPVCHNCGVAVTTPYCSSCGQKKAARFGVGDLGSEAWDKIRWFEVKIVLAGLRVALQPGAVARDYVLGARSSHVHPLKLLLAAIVVLLLVIHQTDYLGSTNATLGRAIELVQSYSKWSFSLGILAVLIASHLTFFRARGFNFVEHLVLATYTHFVILCASILNMAPLLFHSTPELVRQHRAASGVYMDWIEGAIVFFALGQFFTVDWRRQWWRPLIGAFAFVLIKEGLLSLYARAVVRIVMGQLT